MATSNDLEIKRHERKSKSRRRWNDDGDQDGQAQGQNTGFLKIDTKKAVTYEEDDPFAPLDSLRDSVNFEKKLGQGKEPEGRISALYEEVNEERDISDDLMRMGYTQAYLREHHELSTMP